MAGNISLFIFLITSFYLIFFLLFRYDILHIFLLIIFFLMLQDVPECSRMFNVPDFIKGPNDSGMFLMFIQLRENSQTKTKQSNPSNASIDVAI